jgi:regulator of protease activity HflC (stomatin/prohibitin superfamily)
VVEKRNEKIMNTEHYLLLGAAFVAAVWARLRLTEFTVPEGFYGLLYRHGRYQHRLSPGIHRFWKRGHTVQLVDMRQVLLTVPGQEVLTADNVSLKLSAVLTYQIVSPEQALHDVQNHWERLYHAVQAALRTVVAGVDVETLLLKRAGLAPRLLELVQPETDKLGIRAVAVEVKDVMFPAELKRAFAETLKAKQAGQAALERARGETAALRNLVNAARLLEASPALHNLRLLQTLAEKDGAHTFVLGLPTGFVPLTNGKANVTKEEGE